VSATMEQLRERTKVPVGRAPHGHVAYSASLDEVWVLNSGARDITILDGASGAKKRTIDVGAAPRHLIFDNERAVAHVAVDDALAILDATSGKVSRRIPVRGRATCLLPMLPRDRMYVLTDSGEMTIVDHAQGEVIGSVATGRGSSWGQPHENSCGKLYVANAATDDMTIVDEATDNVIATVKVGRRPERNAIFREQGLVYTADRADDTVTAVSIETDQVVATVGTGPHPFRLIGMKKKTGRSDLWVLDRGRADAKGGITVISATDHRVTASIATMDHPCNWLFDGPTAQIVGSGTRDMLMVDGKAAAVVGTAALSEEPDPASFSNMVFSKSGLLFLANANDSVSVFARA
jgi:YVTN family beta-propeller protein